MNLADGFSVHATSSPNLPALLLGDTLLTYHQLAGRVAACQASLQTYLEILDDNTLLSPQRVAWNGSNSPALIVLYLACVRAGCTLVLTDPGWPSTMREAALKRVEPALVVDAEHDIFKHSTVPAENAVATVQHAEACVFLIGFTSGSSGTPKPFVRTQASWLETFAQANREFSAPSGYKVLAPGPLSHGLSFYAMAETLHNGGQFISLPHFDVAMVESLLTSHAIHTLVVVPTMLAALLEHLDGNKTAAGPARIVSAGAKLSVDLRDDLAVQFPLTEIVEYYGASELSFVTISQASESPPSLSVGRAFSGVDIRLLDDNGAAAPVGERGVVWVRSGMLAQGYLAEDGSVKPLADVDGWATVGDIGVFDDNGYLTLLDRASNMLISGGLNVYPADVERILENHSEVAEAVVVGLPDAYWGDRICALVRQHKARNGMQSTNEFFTSLMQHCRELLTPAQRPARLYTVSHWPLTHSGKIDRQALVQAIDDDASSIMLLEFSDD